MNRRRFVSSTTAGLVAASAALRPKAATAATAGTAASAQSAATVKGANERVRIGVIGVGGMGRAHVANFLQHPETQIVAIADVYQFNLDRALDMTASQRTGKAEGLKDFRRLLDRQDIDAVVIATPDHWHAIPMVMACAAGKDVYVEKPIAHTIREGRKMVDAARKHNRVVQVGTQQRSGAHFQEAVQIVREGRIGKVTRVAAWNYGDGSVHGMGQIPDSPPPDGLDWDFWLGPAPQRPFNGNRFIGTFRWFWDYAGGMMTDWGVHLLDVVHWAMNVEAPKAVTTAGAKYLIADNRDTPDTIDALIEYPGFLCTYEHRALNGFLHNRRGYGCEFYGTDGTLFVDRGGYEVTPEPVAGPAPTQAQWANDAANAKRTPLRPWEPRPRRTRTDKFAAWSASTSDQNLTHIRNFYDCLKSRQRPASDIEIGHRSSSVCMLANVSLRTGRKIVWDASKETCVGDGDANALLWREPRAPWSLT